MNCFECVESSKHSDRNIEKLHLLINESKRAYNNSYQRYKFFHEKFKQIIEIKKDFLSMCQLDISEKLDAIESVRTSLDNQCNFFLFENSLFEQIINCDKNIYDEFTFYINLSHNISNDINEYLYQARKRLKKFYIYYSEDNTNKFYEDSINDTILLINICLNIHKYNTQYETNYASIKYPQITKSELQEQINEYITLQEKYKPYNSTDSSIPNICRTSLNYENHNGTTESSSSTGIPNIWAPRRASLPRPYTFYSKSEISDWS